MKIDLYTNAFMHDGKKIMSAALAVRAGRKVCAGLLPVPYVYEDTVFDAAMNLMSLVSSTQRMMEELGHDVEVDSVFDSALGLRDVLKERIEA